MRKFCKLVTVPAVLLLMLGCMVTAAVAKDLGVFTPQNALEYMQGSYPDLVIVDTALPEYFEKQHFEGAINIPAKDMETRHVELPEGSKVLLHCRIGKTCLPAYRVLQQLRPDLDFGYIGGAPLFDAYNAWLLKNRKVTAK